MNVMRGKRQLRRRTRKRKARQLLRGGGSLQPLSSFRRRVESVPGVGTLAVVPYVAPASASETPTSHHRRHTEESSVSKLDNVDAATVARSSEGVSPTTIGRSSLPLVQESSQKVEKDSEILVVQREIRQIQSQIEETVKEISKLLAQLIEPIT